MTTAPYVELGFHPTDLRPRDLPQAGAYLGSPAEALEAAFSVVRAQMVAQMRDETRGLGDPSHSQLLRIADLAWQGAFYRFRKISAPIIADAYMHAYQEANAGDVPMSLIYDLAEKHAEKVGDYFHITSREGLADGFNTLVNRRIPAKAAVDRVLDAYGLTPRQMRAYTSAKQFQTPVSDRLPRSLKAKVREYVDRSFTSRIKKMSAQEEHNIDEQAKQFAWMWLQEKGRLNEKAQKLWVTAKDERVCKVCGPLHGKKVGLNQRFRTSQGEFWTPGLHPNCRCVVRLLEHRFSKSLVADELNEFNELHPREQHGRFSTKARTKTIDVDEEFNRILALPVVQPVRHLTYAPPIAEPATQAVEPDTETDLQFASLIEAQPKRRGFTSVWESPLQRQAVETEHQLDFAADLAVDLRAHTRLMLETRPQLQLTKTPVQPIEPAYAILHREDLQDGELDQLRFNHGITFSTDEIAIAHEVSKEIRERKEAALNHMREEGGLFEVYDEPNEKWYHATLKDDDIDAVVDWYADTATQHQYPGFDPDLNVPQARVVWHDEKDQPTSLGRMPYTELGKKFGLSHEDFEIYVAGVDQVPTHEGAVEQVSGGPNSLQREYSIDGDYELTPDSLHRRPGDGYSMTWFRAEPRRAIQLPEGE